MNRERPAVPQVVAWAAVVGAAASPCSARSTRAPSIFEVVPENWRTLVLTRTARPTPRPAGQRRHTAAQKSERRRFGDRCRRGDERGQVSLPLKHRSETKESE